MNKEIQNEGEWEMDDANASTRHYHCPRCGCYEQSPRNFCPDCGLIMKGVKVYDQM